MSLSHTHQQDLAASAIHPTVIEHRGYQTIQSPKALPDAFTHAQRERHGLLIPIRDVTGEIVTYQLKPDNPRTDAAGKPIKYETASAARRCLDVPGTVRPFLRDIGLPLWITEGAKKVDSGLSAKLPAIIGLLGVDGWSSEGMALPDWKEIALRDRTVVIAFDSDVMTKASVRGALERFARWLAMQGADVRYAILPDRPDGAKQGLDDWFAAGRTRLELEELVTDTLPGSRDDWEPPIPLETRNRPPFPANVLPGVMGAYVDAVAETTQTPRDLPGCAALGAISAAAGGVFVVEVPELDWQEPVHIQTTPTLESGSRKSQVMREMMQPIRDWERARRTDDRLTLATWESTHRVKETQLKKMEADLAKPTKPGTHRPEDLELQIGALVRELETETPPRVTQIIADDATPQSVAKSLHEQDGSLAIVAPEDAFLANIAGKYSSGDPDLDVFLRGHNAEPIRTGRIGREGEDVPRACLTVCISPQPSVIARLGSVPGWISKGGSARLLAAFPLTNVGRRDLRPAPVPAELRTAWEALLVRVLEMERQPADEDGDRLPHVLRLCPEASEEFHEFRAWCEAQFRPGGQFADEGIRSWGSKLAGHVLRLAGLLHIAEHDDPASAPVSETSVMGGITLGSYFLAHAQIMYDLMGGVGAPDEARQILDAIRELGSPTTLRSVHYRVKNRRAFQKAADLNPSLSLLEDLGWVRVTINRETGGRPTTIIALNPRAEEPQKPQKMRSVAFVASSPGLRPITRAPGTERPDEHRQLESEEGSDKEEETPFEDYIRTPGVPQSPTKLEAGQLTRPQTNALPNKSQKPQNPTDEPTSLPPPSMTMEELALLEAEDDSWNADLPRFEPTAEQLRRADWHTAI